MRIGPFKLTDHASHLNGLGGIELGSVSVVRQDYAMREEKASCDRA
jgi:hypothetical protein